ncbi:hypothetical protein HYU22_04460 [Candidatus Woesearchaeota archaeon]|nr:hypothetical protein [Candidatus Woesearchaeota archaeon]
MSKWIYFLLLLAVFSYFVYSAKSPAEFEISGTSCITSSCLVAQKAAFDLNIIPNGENKVSTIWVESDAVDSETIKIIPRQNSPAMAVSFALKDTLEEQNYTLIVKAEVETAGFNGFFWKIKNKFFGDDTFYRQEFAVRYPAMNLELKAINEGNLEAEYNVQLRNKDRRAFTCKIRIETSPDIFIDDITLKPVIDTSERKVYESSPASIGVNEESDCCQSLIFKANTDEGSSTITVLPVCTVDGTGVVITDEIKTDTWRHSKRG